MPLDQLADASRQIAIAQPPERSEIVTGKENRGLLHRLGVEGLAARAVAGSAVFGHVETQ